VNELTGVFFQVYALDAYGIKIAVIPGDFQEPVFAERLLVLGDLVAFGEVDKSNSSGRTGTAG
jgi:hypothetical protein